MSKLSTKKSISVIDLQQAKIDKRKISMVTCYDSAFAKLIAQTNIDSVLVGDSLGNVMLGRADTLSVTLDEMVHHTRSVSSILGSKFLIADLPFGTYQVSAAQALESAIRLIKEGGAHAVKLEGGREVCDQIVAIKEAGIPVVAHLGLTPQSIHQLGGHRVQGKDDQARKRILEDAKLVEAAGAGMLVLELVPGDLAREITQIVGIPTIGIGAGVDCDGQVLVLQDLLGFDTDFNPKFLKKFLNLGELITTALQSYDSEVKEEQFPSENHSY